MKWFKPSKQDENLIQLLKKSSSDFEFDPNSVKYRLLNSITQADQKPVPHFKIGRVAGYSVSFVCLVMVISTTFAFAAGARPGDKLFGLNKFGENMILKLPLSVEQKATVQEYIVTNRLQALDQVKTKQVITTKQAAAKLQTIKESEESLMSAVDNITKTKKKLEASGKTHAAKKLENVLDQLQTSAKKSESKIKEIEAETIDSAAKAEIHDHLQKIEDSRKKARLEIKRFQDTQNNNDD
ncbi:MAG TPA: hypothetical protein VF974_03995 [Patescibacteria group bacterium]